MPSKEEWREWFDLDETREFLKMVQEKWEMAVKAGENTTDTNMTMVLKGETRAYRDVLKLSKEVIQ